MSSSQFLLRRFVALTSGRVRANHRLLSSASSSPAAVAAERAPQSPPETETGAVRMTEGCVRGSGSTAIKKTGMALIIGIYDESMTHSQWIIIVEKHGGYLVEQGF